MKKLLPVVFTSLLLLYSTLELSAVTIDDLAPQTAFYYIKTFDRIIEDPNYMEVCVDAYCYGGQTGQGTAVASVEYDHVMLDNDYDTGSFVTVWAHAGDFQHPENILYPDASKRCAMCPIIEFRYTDLLFTLDQNE